VKGTDVLGGLFALAIAPNPLPDSAVAGMALVESNTNADWAEAALAIVLEVAQDNATFTTDDVWERIEAAGLTVHNNSALGPVMHKAARKGWMSDTMTVKPSQRGTRHGNRLRIWKSNLWKYETTLTVVKGGMR
jgi:hypothetical protein